MGEEASTLFERLGLAVESFRFWEGTPEMEAVIQRSFGLLNTRDPRLGPAMGADHWSPRSKAAIKR